MKNTYILLLSLCSFLYCKSQTTTKIVDTFITSYNSKDSIVTSQILHKDFVELWKKDTVINGPTNYFKHYAWGKVMHDKEEIKIIQADSNSVITRSTYYSDRDRLLNISPYKSQRTYTIKDHKIIKIVGQGFQGYKAYDQPRRKKYDRFFSWLKQHHNLTTFDFPFDAKGAVKLKKTLLDYTKNGQ